ncbi:hypothetical protein [Aquimarina algicola]|uniref:Uncharacterized protein n=1 Tax=Aquimarina algicola TaxID=2589995 RepID=A0A504J277_9FLAO|nr:hypothetical protein [Aquimarina algicola]TPN81703.1 hypothetical protein FHK87_24195 [Aquimarina algicola]
MKNTTLLYIGLLLLIINACVPQSDFDKLKEENERLKKEIADCNLTPSQIIEQAYEYYDKLEYTKSKDRLVFLIDKYPDSKPARKGKSLLKKVEKEILQNEKALQKEKQKEDSNENYKEALSKMKKKYDVANEVTWYSDKTSTQYNDDNFIQAYIGKKEKRKPWLGLSINYFSKEDWLFIQKIEITTDDKTHVIEENTPGEFNAKEESGGKREWLDRIVKEKDFALLKAIASCKKGNIKFTGKNKEKSINISKGEIKAIQNILNAYTALGGKTDL